MSVFRRPEIIVLAAIVLAVVGWVVFDDASRSTPRRAESSLRDAAITSAVAIPDGSRRRLRLEVVAFNARETPFEWRAPAVRLLAAGDVAVPEFFQPGQFPPTIPPATKSAGTLEFWLTADQAAAPLELEVDGRRIPVPAARIAD